VRTKPLIGRKAWFGPRRMGWGLAPVTAEGWAVVAVAVAAAIVLATADPHARWLSLIVVAVLLILTFLKGTSPGGPAAWEEYRATRDGNRDS
jgi:apolipoprotein N-acyltransferase